MQAPNGQWASFAEVLYNPSQQYLLHKKCVKGLLSIPDESKSKCPAHCLSIKILENAGREVSAVSPRLPTFVQSAHSDISQALSNLYLASRFPVSLHSETKPSGNEKVTVLKP